MVDRVGRFAILAVSIFLAGAGVGLAQESVGILIADVKHEGPVDFERELLPVLRRSCLACHNATVKESELVLETPQTILKGGASGPAVVAGKSAESLLLKAAAHQGEPIMPPEKNDKGAKNLSSEELGLLKLWIDQGAAGQVLGAAGPVDWQPLPAGVNPIYAVSVSSDGQFVAAGRANQVFIYHAPSKREIGRLTDPSLVQPGGDGRRGVAELDLVQSLAFSPDNQFLASGGFRTVKLWRRPRNVKLAEFAGVDNPPSSAAMSADGKWAACGQENGAIKIFDVAARQLKYTLAGHTAAVSGLAISADGTRLLSGSQDKSLRLWRLGSVEEGGGAQIGLIDTPAPVNAVAFVAPDNIASGHADNGLRLWAIPAADAAPAATPVKELAGHGGPVTSLAALPAVNHLVTGCQDGAVRVYDVASGNVVRQMGHGSPVASVAVTLDGKRVASVGGGNITRLWNNENGQQVAEMKGDFRAQLNVDDVARAVELARQKIETAKKDLEESNKRKTAEDENLKKSEEAKKSDEELTAKTEAAKKPVADKEAADKELADSKTALTSAEETKKTAEAEATRLVEALQKTQADAEAANKTAVESAEAARLAAEKLVQAKDAAGKDTANQDLAAAAQEAEKQSLDAEAKKKAADEAKAAADKAVVDADAASKTQEAAKQKAEQDLTAAQNEMKELEAKVTQLTEPAQKAVDERMSAERSAKGAERSVERAKESVQKAADEIPKMDELVKQADAAAKEREASLEQSRQAATAAEKASFSVAFSADSLTLAVGGDDQIIHTYDAETGAPIDTQSGHAAPVIGLAFSPAHDILGVAKNNTVVLWDHLPEWTLERTIGNPDSPETFVDRVTSLDFSGDGALIAAGGGEPSRSGQIKIFNVADGALVRELKEPHSDTVLALDFSPNNQHLASCGADRFMKVFSVATGEFARSFEGHTHHVLGVAWRADGRFLATSGADNVIKVWDFTTGDQSRTIQGFGKEVTSVRFISITPQVAVSCGDANVYVKNAENGGNVRNYGGASDFMHCVNVAPDGKLIVGGGQDSVLRLWRDDGQSIATFAPPSGG